jgi:hypothetical protein
VSEVGALRAIVTITASFDHLVGAGEPRGGIERLGRLGDGQSYLVGACTCRSDGALEDAISVTGCLPKLVSSDQPIFAVPCGL